MIVVGDGSDRAALVEQTHRLGLAERVIFLAPRRDIPQLLPAMDLLVSSSLREVMPNVVMEAMAAGLPVVATDVGGTAEVVEHGMTGLLIPPRDAAALTHAIGTLLKHPEQRRLMGQAGRRRIQQQFSLDTTVAKTVAIYDALLDGKIAGVARH